MTAAGTFHRNKGIDLALWLAAAGVLAILWSALCTVPGLYWNPPRLAPSYALAGGLNIYATPDAGPYLGWVYGPMFALWGVPAAWVPQITWSFVVWALLNYLAMLVPVWLVLRDAAGSGRLAGQGLLLYLVLFLANAVTQSLVFLIHVDGLCFGFGTLACWGLHRAAFGRGLRYLHLAALAVILAIWTKQVAISLVPGLFLWLWWMRRTRLMPPLLLWLVVYGGGVTAGFFRWFGGEALLFSLWQVHVLNPLKGGWSLLGGEILRMLGSGGVWLAAAALLALAPRRAAGAEPGGSGWFKLLGCVALCHLPLGLAAVIKAGGGINSVHSLYYVLLLLALALMRLLEPGRRPGPGTAWISPAVVIAGVVALGLGHAFYLVVDRGAVWRPYRGQEAMLHMARMAAGHMYFPWNPLLTLITDKKIYPFDDALYCLWLSGLEVPVARVRDSLPPGVVVFYEEPAQSHFALNYFPGYKTGNRATSGRQP
jgi:hypothetical protein